MLPEPLRHDSGHDGSHTFLTHEFIDALVKGRRPAVADVLEAGARGAALFGGLAAGMFDGVEDFPAPGATDV